jgi:hypothetical protein
MESGAPMPAFLNYLLIQMASALGLPEQVRALMRRARHDMEKPSGWIDDA